MKIKTAFFATGFTLFLPFLALAQETVAPPETQVVPDGVEETISEGDIRSVVVADVNVTDVQVEEKDGTLTGTFALQGKLGTQEEIAYGIVVLGGEGNTILDVYPLGADVSVNEGEIKTIPFTYPLPTYLAGQASVWIMAETAGGLPLGSQLLLESDFHPTSARYLSCALSSESEFTCSHALGSALSISNHAGSPLAAPVTETKVDAPAGVPITVKPGLSPGSHTIMVRDGNGERVMLDFYVPGAFGIIQNLILYPDETGGTLTGVVAIAASPTQGLKVAATLASDDGSACGETDASVDGLTAEFSVVATCPAGVAQVRLVDAAGQVLDTRESRFGTDGIAVTPAAERASLWLLLAVGGVALLGAVGMIFYRRRSVPTTILPVFIVLGMALCASPADALTLSVNTVGPYGCGACEEGYITKYVVGTDKSAYAPGETLQVTALVYWGRDIGRRTSDRLTGNLRYLNDASGLLPKWDTAWSGSGAELLLLGNSIPDSLVPFPYAERTPYKTAIKDFVLPGTLSSGSHYLALRASIWAYTTLGLNYDTDVLAGNLTFDVTSAAATSCDLGCGGSVRWRTNATSATNDFTCPAGSKLSVTGGSWSGAACSGTFTRDPLGGQMRCVADATCVAPSTCTWEDAGYVNGFYEVQNNSRAGDVCDTTKPSWYLTNTCSGIIVGSASTRAHGYICYTPSTKFPGVGAPYETGMCMAKAYRTVCTGGGPLPPTVRLKGDRLITAGTVGIHSLWQRAIAWLKQSVIETALAGTNPADPLTLGQGVRITWNSLNATRCSYVSTHSPSNVVQIPAALVPEGSADIWGLPLGSHTITITCWNGLGPTAPSDSDSITVIVSAAASLKTCPQGTIPLLGHGNTTQLEAWYRASGTVNCANASSTADNVTRDAAWLSSDESIATVIDNGANSGRVTSVSNVTGDTATISASYTNPATGVTSSDAGTSVQIICTPTNSCLSPSSLAQSANTCPDDDPDKDGVVGFTVDNGCGVLENCTGTRTCDFNWKEVGQ